MSIEKWTHIETRITPKTLRTWADRLERDMDKTRVGEDVPKIEYKDWNSNIIIVFVADQDAFHKHSLQGQWK